MQLSFRQKEQFFHELAQLNRSGIPLPAGLEMLGRSRRAGGRAAQRILDALKSSSSASQAFMASGFPASDGAIIEAGEASGRLDQVFDELGNYYYQMTEARSLIMRRSTYAVFVLHFGAIALALPAAIVAGSLATFFAKCLPVIFSFYGCVIVAYLFWQVVLGAFARSMLAARIITAVPLFGALLSNLTAWKFSLVLSLYVRAGGGMLKGFLLAGASCGNAIISSASAKAVPRVQNNGETLTVAFCRQPGLPELLERSIEVGERSGRLDEETARAAELYKLRTMKLMDMIARTVPVIVYLCVVIYTAYSIIGMTKELYLNPIEKLSEPDM